MWSLLCVFWRSFLRSGGVGLLALHLAPGAQIEGGVSRDAGIESTPILLTGRVLDLDGGPAAGAVVVSSAGGRAVTDARGDYRLEVPVPLDAWRVRLTAATRARGSTLSASAEVAISATGSATPGTLLLAQVECCEQSWVPEFGEQPGVGGTISSFAVFDGGSGPALYAGGVFSVAGGVEARGVAAWDGSRWSTLGGVGGGGAPSGPFVQAFAVFDDGGGPALYAGGNFVSAGGVTVNRIAKWDGASWSALGSGVSGSFPHVDALAVFDDGGGPALYVGGVFSAASGTVVGNIARWDGTSWSALGSGVSVSNDGVLALTVFDDGTGAALYAGGGFTSAGGVPVGSIARWDGSSWSALGTGMNGRVNALAVFDDGGGPALYAGGVFTTAGGVAASYVARWDGTSWSALGSGITDTGPGSSSGVKALALFDDGSGPALYASGDFTSAGGTAVSNIARWDGTAWSALGTGLGDTNRIVRALAVFDAGGGEALYAGGDFQTAGGLAVKNLARWDGAGWTVVGSGLNAAVHALSAFDDGGGATLHVGGDFETAGGGPMARIARWDGSAWSDLAGGMDGSVYALEVFDDGSGSALFAGGSFTTAGGVAASCIARWDGSSWTPLGAGVSVPPGSLDVRALIVFDDGSGPALFAGGSFQRAGTELAHGIAKWDGSTWQALGSGVDLGIVEALVVFDDGSGPALHAADVNGTAHRVMRWDGSSWSALGSGMSATVFALAVFDDGTGPALYAAGQFTTAGGVTASRIARWDGSTWTAVGGGLNSVANALLVFDDGHGPALYVGGNFRTAGGLACSRIARWDGATWSALGGGMTGSQGNSPVDALLGFDDGSGTALFAGGNFDVTVDSHDSFLAKWACVDTTPPTIDCPPGVIVVDRDAPGEIVTFTVTGSDPCDAQPPSVVCLPPSGSFFPRGKTTVTCTATDAAGNQSSCSFPVSVVRPPHFR